MQTPPLRAPLRATWLYTGALAVLLLGCSGTARLTFEPSRIDGGAWAETRLRLSLGPQHYLSARGGQVGPVADLQVHVGESEASVEEVTGEAIVARLSRPLPPGSYPILVHARGRRYRAAARLMIMAGGAFPDGGAPPDAGRTRDAATPADGGTVDAGPLDAGMDAGPPDAGPSDAGPPDAGPPDAGPPDAGPPDAGPPDAGPPDAGPPDAGPPDAGPPDAGGSPEVCEGIDNDLDGTIDNGGVCPCTHADRNNHAYLFCQMPMNWADARAFCQNLGYDLVVLENAAENTWVSDTHLAVQMTRDWWIGFHDQMVEGDFRWVNGASTSFTAWGAFQPDDFGDEDCVFYSFLMPTEWWDFSCASERNFICETQN